jgi:hypothetical protein
MTTPLEEQIKITAQKTPHPKCPRCYRYQPECNYNFDSLCDRCCAVIPEGHPSYEGIKASRKDQSGWTRSQWIERNHAIDPIAKP